MKKQISMKRMGAAGAFSLAIAAVIIAIVLGGAALGITLSTPHSSNNSSLSSEYSQLSTNYASLSSEFTALNSSVMNQPPQVAAIKIQWCTLDVAQDRFCPQTFAVVQGDIVQIFFLQNDTAAHTFTLDTSPYNFQINASGAGELDFLNNYAPIAGNCIDTGTFNQISAGISGTYCVSGSSLLPQATLQSYAATNFYVAQNPNPGYPMTPGSETVAGTDPSAGITNPSVVEYPVNYQTVVIGMNVSGTGVNAVCGGQECATQGIGAFQATAPGVYEYFCHYHVSNGMYGYMIVLPNAYCNTHASACGES